MDTEQNEEVNENADLDTESVQENDDQENDGPKNSLEAMEQALGMNDEEDTTSEKAPNAKDSEEEQGKEEEIQKSENNAEENKEVTKNGDDDELIKPLPEDVKEETRERFDKLTEGYKTLKIQNEAYEQENTQLKHDNTEFQQLIQYSGADPEEFDQLIQYSHMVKTGKLKDAMELLNQQRLQLAQIMGVSLPDVDMLSDHPDLQDQVNNYGMNPEIANELAASRNRQAVAEKNRQAQEEEQRQQHETEANRQKRFDEAQTAIVKLASKWSETDIDYSAKHELLMKKAAEIAQTKAPELWPDALELYYESLSVSQSTNANETDPGTHAGTGKPKHRPLRPSGGAGGTSAPKTSLEAMEQSLGYS